MDKRYTVLVDFNLQVTVVDNHKHDWKDFYDCATIGTLQTDDPRVADNFKNLCDER
jgi:hypothetical protein